MDPTTPVRNDHIRRYGPVNLVEGRNSPTRVRRGFLQPGVSADQVSSLGSSQFVRGTELSNLRALIATSGRFEVFEWRTAEGLAIRSLGKVSATHDAGGFRPQMVRVDDHRALLLWSGGNGSTVMLSVFDDRTMTTTELSTGLGGPTDPYAHNPKLTAIAVGETIRIFIAPNSNDGHEFGYAYTYLNGTLSLQRSISLSDDPGGTPLGFEPGGVVVLSCTFTDSNTLLVLGRKGIGTDLRYFWEGVRWSTGAVGPQESPLYYTTSPDGGTGDTWEYSRDVYQSSAMAQGAKTNGWVLGIMSRKGRFNPSGPANDYTLTATRPGHRFFLAKVNPTTLAVTLQVDELLLLNVINFTDAQQFLFDDISLSRDTGDRYGANAYAGGAGGYSGGQQSRTFGFDLGYRAPVNQVSDVRLLLGYQTFQYDPNTFDAFSISGDLNYGTSIPIFAPPRNPNLPVGPTRAWFLVNNGSQFLQKARVYHFQSATRGLLATKVRQRTSDFDDYYRDFLL
jgi:hypothetical protein